MAKYENIDDKLGLGKHIIKLEPQDEYDKTEGKFIKGQQRTGVSKTGNKWWMYNTPEHTDSQGHRFKVLAFDQKQKELFDTGTVEINVLAGKNFDLNEQGNPYQDEKGEFVKKKKAFFNPISDREYDRQFDSQRSTVNEEEPFTTADLEGMF